MERWAFAFIFELFRLIIKLHILSVSKILKKFANFFIFFIFMFFLTPLAFAKYFKIF